MTQLQLDLFETKPAQQHPQSLCAGGCLTHVLMPNMGYACGETILTVAGHFEMGTSNFDKVTCPGCRAEGIEEIRVRMRRQMGQCIGCRQRVTDTDYCKACAT